MELVFNRDRWKKLFSNKKDVVADFIRENIKPSYAVFL